MKKILKKLKKNQSDIKERVDLAEQIMHPPTITFNLYRNIDAELDKLFKEVQELKKQRIKLLKKLNLEVSNQIIKLEKLCTTKITQ